MMPFPPPVHPYMPLVITHIAGGIVDILAGYTAVVAVKGEPLHRIAGKVFVIAMLIAMGVAVYLAVLLRDQLPGQISNIVGGTLGFYLVLSAYMTVKRKEGTIGLFEKLWLLIPLAIGALYVQWGFAALNSPAHAFDGYPPPLFFVFAGISFLLAALDIKMVIQGGLRGVARIARHLWRMCFGFFFASGSFFLGQQKVMPLWIQGSPALWVLGLAPFAFMIFWLVRVRLTHWYTNRTFPLAAE